MRPRLVLVVAGVIVTVAMGQLIANVAIGQEQDEPERGSARVSVEVAPAQTPAVAAKPANAPVDRPGDGPGDGEDEAPLEMSVVDVEPRDCPDEPDAKTRLGLLERSAVNSLCD